mgnify:CR=1 FL=1
MTMITANSHQYSDQGEASRDMRNHGWELWLLPMLSDVMFEVQNASTYASSALTQANNAAASATLAQNYAAALRGTSTTSNTISSGTKNWTTQTGKQWAAGQWVLIADAANPTVNYLNSQVVSYNSGTGALQTTTAVTGANGSGTLTSWTINVSGPNGAQGSTGASGSQDLTRSARSTSGSIVPLDKATIIEARTAIAAGATTTEVLPMSRCVASAITMSSFEPGHHIVQVADRFVQ